MSLIVSVGRVFANDSILGHGKPKTLKMVLDSSLFNTQQYKVRIEGNRCGAILNKSWQQHPTRHQLYGQLPPITKTIQVRRTRHAGHCWRSRDELIRDVLLWIPTHGRAKAGRPARTYIQQLCEDTGCCPENLPRAMNDREEWRVRVRDIRAASTIWWWWWSRVKWSNPGKWIAPSPTSRCSSYWKGSHRVAIKYNRQLYLLFLIEKYLRAFYNLPSSKR